MKLARTSVIIFTFLFAFVFQGLAQSDKTRIVWKNFQTEYKSLEYIVPVIKNEGDKAITFLPSWILKDFVTAHLLVLNEENQNWRSAGNYLTCGLTFQVKDQSVIKILPQEEKIIQLDFGETFFTFSENKFNSKNRFKILLSFRSESSKENFEITSPEFSIGKE